MEPNKITTKPRINWRIVLTALVLAGIVAWLFLYDGVDKIKNLLKPKENGQNQPGTPNANSMTTADPAGPVQTTAVSFPLKYGADTRRTPENYVKNLQEVCIAHGMNIAADGIWGPKTEEALQNLKDLELDANIDGFNPVITLLWSKLAALGFKKVKDVVTGKIIAKGTPYKPYVNPVVKPSNAKSKVQITSISDYLHIIDVKETLKK